MSSDKALSGDGIQDKLFKGHNRCTQKKKLCKICKKKAELIENCFDPVYWNDKEKSSIHFTARLIPLNKEFPNVPAPSKYRPIIVLSPLIKVLELYLLPKLNSYL